MRADQELRRERVVQRVARAGRQLTAPLRAQPSFLIIGTQKGGTTTLFDFVAEHPDVRAPRYKEVHYFDRYADRPYSQYLASFPHGSSMTGEATPYYLFHPYVPERVSERLPDVKLIALLRDPVDRALSHHNHNVALGFEDLPFEAALDAEEERLAGEAEKLAAPGALSSAHRHFSYAARGRYAEQLERWFERFPRDRFLIVASEDFFADPVSTYREVLDFLGLRAHDPGVIDARNARSYGDMPAATRERLRARFTEDNQRLHELLGRDFDW
jgi:hypothetical protein